MRPLVSPLAVILILMMAVFNSCEKEDPPEPKVDHLPPKVRIILPLDQSKVTDTVIVRVLATDENGIKKVALYVDGLPLDGVTDAAEPYELAWNTYMCEDSSVHVLTARAYDPNGNMTDSDPVTCQVIHSTAYPAPVQINSIYYEDGSFVISWAPFSAQHFKSYTLLESLDPEFHPYEEVWTSENIEDTSVAIEGISVGETRYYCLKVTNTMELSALSEIVTGWAGNLQLEGLVAYYPFSGDALDETGLGHDGVNMGAELADDRYGNPASAYAFGDEMFIEIQSHNDLFFPDGFTLAAWVYPTSISAHSNIISRVSPNRDFVMQLVEDNRLMAHYATGSSYSMTFSVDPVPLDNWSHVACVYKASSWKLFVNGSLAAYQTFGTNEPPWTGTVMLIGALNYGEYFHGRIDDVMVFNRPLSDAEIGLLYQ